jgi:hypothetical protein
MVQLPPGATIEGIRRSYITRAGLITQRVSQTVATQFVNLGSWRDSDVDPYLRTVLPVVTAGKRQISSLTRAYYAANAAFYDQPFVDSSMVAGALTAQALRGVPDSQVYARGFTTMRATLSQGASLAAAVQAGANRLSLSARTDLQLAKTHTGRAARGNNGNIVGYMRVLTGAENCALCFVASTQRYRRGDLLPIHPGCDCTEAPIYGDTDPGRIIDENTLEAAHEAVEARFGESARDAKTIDYSKITIRNHGELGPVLTVTGHHFKNV